MMKWLLLALLVLAGVWLGKRQQLRRSQAPESARQLRTTPMLACAHCGVHVPANEAIAGQAGMHFCSAAHRQAHERQIANP